EKLHHAIFTVVFTVFFTVAFTLLTYARPAFGRSYVTPTERVPHSQWPFFSDDLDFKGLKTVITGQLNLFNVIDLSGGTIQYGDEQYPLIRVRKSLEKFLRIVDEYSACEPDGGTECIYWFNHELRRNFNLYRPHLVPGDPNYGQPDPAFFTGYYTPLMTVSKTRTGVYQHGIYALPKDNSLRLMNRDQIDFHDGLE